MGTLSEISCTAVRYLLQTLEMNQLRQDNDPPLNPSVTAYNSMYAGKCDKELRRYEAKQVTKDAMKELSSLIAASFSGSGSVLIEDVLSLTSSREAVGRLTDIVKFHMACLRYKIDEDYSLKYYVCAEKTRKMYEDLLNHRCEEARAPYEQTIAALKAEAREVFRKLKVVEERCQRLEFVNRVQGSRIDAYAVADAKSLNKIAGLEEQLEMVMREWYNGNPVEAKFKIESMQEEQKKLVVEIDELKQFEAGVSEGIKAYKELLDKAESTQVLKSQQSAGRKSETGMDENGGPPHKRIRIEEDLGERDSHSKYWDALEYEQGSSLPQSSKDGSTSSAQSTLMTDWRQRLVQRVINRVTCSIV